ncbi:AAA family ATPase [Candidatus Dependentiae bacterium]|nr:AAA family ATPase [Candidatus Dependentiae bacterium]
MIQKTILKTTLIALLFAPSLNKAASFGGFMRGTRDTVITLSILASIYLAWVHFSATTDEAILMNQLLAQNAIPSHIKKIITSKIKYASLRRNTYISYVLKYPWEKQFPPAVNLSKAHETLQSHHGMNLVKTHILEQVALLQLNPSLKLRPICLVGPSGTGKTSIAQVIARAMNRPFNILSMGNDEKYFRGFEYTYEGSEPGAFMKLHTNFKNKFSVILFDELDKLNNKAAQTILEALDPERNSEYQDTFMDFPIDLSNHFFIATANDLSKIPSAIKDRMTIINVDPYTPKEKEIIALKNFIPKLKEEYNLPEDAIAELTALMPLIIERTSRTIEGENGVRTLQQALKSLAAKYYTAFLMGKKISITKENLSSYLDPQFSEFRLSDTPEDAIMYANTHLKRLRVSQEIFRRIEDRISDFKGYADKTSATLIRTYVDWILKYPFVSQQPKTPQFSEIMAQLNATHYGIWHIKKIICEYLAGFLKSNGKSKKILCFHGYPGVGKTMAAESIAKALNRPFIKISLSNIRNFSNEYQQHPGHLAKALISAKSQYPVILFDELDKMDASLFTELLEAFDTNQNNAIKDHYLNINIDLSNALIIATANDIERIPHPLLNRMELVQIHPYTVQERLEIAKKHLLPKILQLIPLQDESVAALEKITPEITIILSQYEAGVRKLNQLLTKAAEQLAFIELTETSEKTKLIQEITAEKIIGAESADILQEWDASKPLTIPTIGVVNGMYAGGACGGGLLKIQANIIPGGTGLLIKNELGGKTAQISHQQTLMFIKTFADKLGIHSEILKNSDFAITKQDYNEFDGPSAGIAQTVALISALTKRPVKPGYAVTGAMDALGNLIPVGGYRDKIQGTIYAGITQFVVPECARRTIETLLPELPEITVHFVKTIDEAVNILLEKP